MYLSGAVPSGIDYCYYCGLSDFGSSPFSVARSDWHVDPIAYRILGLTVVWSIINGHFVSRVDNVAAYRAALNVYAGAEHMLPRTLIISEGGVR